MARSARRFRIAAAGAAIGGYAVWVRRWMRTWGATPDEVAAPMPGDDLVPDPQTGATRAITIQARPEELWPFVVSMHGLRSFRPDDILRALGWSRTGPASDGDGEDRPLQEGDAIPAGRGHIEVVKIEPNRLLLIRHDGLGYSYSWSTVLSAAGDGATRLVTRNRYHGNMLYPVVLDPLLFAMIRRWLLGLKASAEAAHRAHGAADAHAT